MVDRVEEEYRLAQRIRVSSAWARESLINGGVPAEKVFVFDQPVNLQRFRPSVGRPPCEGRLRLCFVGSLDVRKGFVYLLRAMRRIGRDRTSLRIVGATGSRSCRNLFAREQQGLNVSVGPGDPVPVYHQSELLVLPSLEDGFGFVVAEAMACGLPVIVTDQCGAAGWVQNGHTGWVIPAGDEGALAVTLERALAIRTDLVAMGQEARREVDRRMMLQPDAKLCEWFYQAG
jgi:glycosyltransferase involved in cell wall biosynthesis